MKSGLIRKILDYYFYREKYKPETSWALKEFLGKSQDSVILSVDEAIAPFFNEWFVYDFVLKNGKRVIEDYCDLNPYKFGLVDLAECRCLIKNIYGFLKILHVDIGKGLEIEDIASGDKFYVREVSATYELSPGDIIISRIAKIGDHYELVSADGPKLGKIKGLEMFKERPTPKDTYFLLHGRVEESKEENTSKEEAEICLEEILAKSILGKHISLALIKKWLKDFSNSDKDDSTAAIKILRIIASLLICREKPENKYLDEIINSVQVIYNNTPQKWLGGKSPEQKKTEIEPAREDDLVFSKIPIGGEQCEDLAEEFMNLMQRRLMKEAVKKADDFFSKAIKNYYAGAEIFRYYGNLSVCYFFLENYPRAWEALDISLKLNPNYDFGIDLSKKFKNTEKFKTAVKIKGKKSPAMEYYDFLRGLGIHFSTEKITKSKRFNI